MISDKVKLFYSPMSEGNAANRPRLSFLVTKRTKISTDNSFQLSDRRNKMSWSISVVGFLLLDHRYFWVYRIPAVHNPIDCSSSSSSLGSDSKQTFKETSWSFRITAWRLNWNFNWLYKATRWWRWSSDAGCWMGVLLDVDCCHNKYPETSTYLFPKNIKQFPLFISTSSGHKRRDVANLSEIPDR